MKNKIILIFLTVLILCPSLQAKEKDLAKLGAGIVLAAAGGLMAYHGFQLADVSYPAISMQSFVTVTSGTGPWDIAANGSLKNTGNVDLRNIAITVFYNDATGTEITKTVTNLADPLATGKTTLLNITPVSMVLEPFFFSVNYRADFDTRLENFSIPEGVSGSIILAAGVFLVFDYVFDLTDFLERNDAGIQLSAVNDGFTVMTSKRF